MYCKNCGEFKTPDKMILKQVKGEDFSLPFCSEKCIKEYETRIKEAPDSLPNDHSIPIGIEETKKESPKSIQNENTVLLLELRESNEQSLKIELQCSKQKAKVLIREISSILFGKV